MTITIQKGVPVPPMRAGAPIPYPFDQMVPGDSFAVALVEGKKVEVLRATLTGFAHKWAKRHAPGAKFCTRVEEGGKAVRIWMLTKPVPLGSVPAVVPPPQYRPRAQARQQRGREVRCGRAHARAEGGCADQGRVRARHAEFHQRRQSARRLG